MIRIIPVLFIKNGLIKEVKDFPVTKLYKQ